jgi:hypothetical protein
MRPALTSAGLYPATDRVPGADGQWLRGPEEPALICINGDLQQELRGVKTKTGISAGLASGGAPALPPARRMGVSAIRAFFLVRHVDDLHRHFHVLLAILVQRMALFRGEVILRIHAVLFLVGDEVALHFEHLLDQFLFLAHGIKTSRKMDRFWARTVTDNPQIVGYA